MAQTKYKSFFNKNELVEFDRETLTFGAAETVKSFEINTSCRFLMALVEVANFTNAVTATLSVENRHGIELFTKGSLPKNANSVVISMVGTDVFEVALSGKNTVKVTLSGAPGGAGGDVLVTIYGR